MRKRLTASIIIALLCSLPCLADGTDSLSLAGMLREDVVFLTDSLRQGRATGSQGAQDAAFYICGTFRNHGLRTRIQCFDANGKAGHNIIGEFRGDHGSNSWILVCASYDGLGMPGGKLLPGADANASGVAAMLSLVPGLKRSGKNILYVALDGHYANLSGAFAIAGAGYRISQVINLDSVGTTLAPVDRFRKEYLIALGVTPRQRTLLLKLNGTDPDGGPFEKGKPGLHLYFDYYRSKSFTEMFYRRISDQKPFVEKSVPAVMFTSGITMKTNKESDDAGSLDYPVFERRVELIRQFIISL